jgi:hypothetical protein
MRRKFIHQQLVFCAFIPACPRMPSMAGTFVVLSAR